MFLFLTIDFVFGEGSEIDEMLHFTALYGSRHEKTCLLGFANNTGAGQPGHQRSLISTFVIRFLESFICLLTKGKISIF